ncbi:ATP-binding protein [Massilia sp. AB1]|uniref:hybrid sensor histidine kinase/response regulator n=1 Tax=Massilia sp. AB1 TaxID=2823371 RepID=UPI001B83A199|nr:ATP-binding protein [Massilia sp. AB1]MBQ5941060.1 response regulator [Massilia sp. AB1]
MTEPQPESHRETAPRPRPTVLFICNRPGVDPVVSQISDELGQAIVRVQTAAEGLAQARSHDFALILAGYAGDAAMLLNTIRLMRANLRSLHTPIIALSLPPQAELPARLPVEALYEAGAIAVLHAPLSPAILRAKARFYIDAFNSMAERQRAESALMDTQARLETIIAAAELAVWSWDIAADRVSADARMAALFGIDPAEAGEAPLAAYLAALHPDDVPPLQAALAEAIARGGVYDVTFRVRILGGAWRWAIARGHVDQDASGAALRIRGVVIDATRQFEAEQQLRLTEERYRTLFDSVDEGLCVIEMLYDSNGQAVDYRFLETNPAFVKHTGLAAAVGKTARQMAPRLEAHWFHTYGRVAASGEPVRFVNEARELGRWFDVYATRLGPPEWRRVAVLFSDITERRRSEDALRKMASDLSEANRLKTEFLATLAHELRNPLAPIRSGLQFIRRAPGDAQAVTRVHDIMERQLSHLVHLVDDLLDVARITRGQVELKREPVDLATVLSSAVETSMPQIEAARHYLDVRMPNEALLLDADPTRLTQVISNLLNNAARYTPRGGRIVLAAERDGGQAVIAVSDNGIGIAPDKLEDVFKMFTQVGQGQQPGAGGLGIGLSLVRSLVELHGGSVRAASDGTNAGSVFTVRLPLHASQQGHPPPQEPAQAANDAPGGMEAGAGAGLSVLVVDDNRDAAETLSALLNLLGHSAPVANDGHQALRMLPGLRPQVVFLDLGMPGMSGYEVASAIRTEPAYAGIKLVALTGWGGEADRARTAAAGFDLHLTKPATLEAIQEVLAQV